MESKQSNESTRFSLHPSILNTQLDRCINFTHKMQASLTSIQSWWSSHVCLLCIPYFRHSKPLALIQEDSRATNFLLGSFSSESHIPKDAGNVLLWRTRSRRRGDDSVSFLMKRKEGKRKRKKKDDLQLGRSLNSIAENSQSALVYTKKTPQK